jgi:23S rRNA (uracil1939-C5)-methyltransferase
VGSNAPGPGDPVDLVIDGLDEQGAGTGTVDQASPPLRVHVAGALPGERVAVRLAHVSAHAGGPVRQAWAQLVSVTQPSPDRVDVACPAHGSCGGCALMALAYPAQLAGKRRRVLAQLARYPALAGLAVDETVPSPARLGYRNHAKYVHGRCTPGGSPALGGYAPRSHRLVDLAGCRVVVPVLDEIRGTLLELLDAHAVEPFDERLRTGVLRYVVMHANEASRVLVTLVAGRPEGQLAEALAQALAARCPAVAGVVLNLNATAGNRILGENERLLWGAASLDDRVGEARVRLSSRSFFQANREVAGLIQRAILAALPGRLARAVDVYAGAAPFALALAPFADEVIAIEENPAASATAAAFLAEQGATERRVRMVTDDAAAGLAAVGTADVVVLDPPRKGCTTEVLAAAVGLRPALLAYVSCDPGSLARDLDLLVSAGGRVARITPFDMMPHTPHVEALALVAFR